MQQYLFNQFIDNSPLDAELDRLGFSESEKDAVYKHIDQIFRHKILISVLDELSTEKKIDFVAVLDQGSDIKIVDFVKSNIKDVDTKLKTLAHQTHAEIFEDLTDL